jgi:molecular chaperone DnaJ
MAQAQREWFEKDYYKVLGVADSATESEIRRAYRKLAKENHPDTHPGSEERFKEISSAYDVISDPAKRKQYDDVRRLGPGAGRSPFGGAGAPGGAGGPGGTAFTFSADDIGGLFGNLFNRARPGAEGTREDGMGRGRDLEAELHLSFQDAVGGVTTAVNVTSEAACRTCGGGGAAPGTSAVVCSRCAGRGVVDDNQGFFSFSRACAECRGRGMVVESPCQSCGGSGVELRPRQVKVRIPAGVDDGQRIRLKARGGSGRNGGPPGDLFVTVRVAAHAVFGRRGRDLTLTVPITFAEAALGAEITVPTLDGSMRIKVPPGTRSGRTFRARGHGIASGDRVGDLLVTVEVAVPTRLSDAERDAIEALSEAQAESPRTYLGV